MNPPCSCGSHGGGLLSSHQGPQSRGMSLREQETRRILLNTQYELAQIRPQLSQMGQELRDMRYQEETSLEEKNEMFLKMTQAVKDKEDFEESFDDRLVQDVLHIKKNLEDEKQKWMKEVEAEFEQKLAAKDAEHANDLDKQLDDLMVFMNNDFNAIKENNNADIAILKDQIKKLEEALAKALSSSEQPLLDSTEQAVDDSLQIADDLPLSPFVFAKPGKRQPESIKNKEEHSIASEDMPIALQQGVKDQMLFLDDKRRGIMSRVSKSGSCVCCRAIGGGGSCQWTHNQGFACKACTNAKRFCLMKITNKVFKGAAVVLPLARKFRAGVLPTETEFYKRPLIQTEIKEELEEGEVREDV